MNFLKIKDVRHTYFTKTSATTALSDISLDIEEGEFISFLGPSGCGKTTLLSIIAGLVKPTEGVVTLEGKLINTKKNDIGYMLQQDYLFPWKTIEENILLGLKISKQLDAAKKQQTLQLLSRMGLTGIEKQNPRQLSGGMIQLAALLISKRNSILKTMYLKHLNLSIKQPF